MELIAQNLELINFLFLVIFTTLVAMVLIRILIRRAEYLREGITPPLLLRRDLIFFLGLSIPFVFLLFFRATNSSFTDEEWYPLWVVISSASAIFGVAYWAYYEYFKVEH